MRSTWKQKWAWWKPKGLQKLRVTGTDDADKSGILGMDNGGC